MWLRFNSWGVGLKSIIDKFLSYWVDEDNNYWVDEDGNLWISED